MQIDEIGRRDERVGVDAAKQGKQTEIEKKEAPHKDDITEENEDEEDDGLPLSMLMMKPRHRPDFSQPAPAEEEKEEKLLQGYAVLRHSSPTLFGIKSLYVPASSLRDNDQEISPNFLLSTTSPPVGSVVFGYLQRA